MLVRKAMCFTEIFCFVKKWWWGGC